MLALSDGGVDMTDENLLSLERALGHALDIGDASAHRRLMGTAITGLIREVHLDRAAVQTLTAQVAGRSALVDARLTAIEAAQLTSEQREAVVAVVSLGARAVELADRIGAVMAWLRRVAMWLTPVLAFVAALAAARAVLAGWSGEIITWWRR